MEDENPEDLLESAHISRFPLKTSLWCHEVTGRSLSGWPRNALSKSQGCRDFTERRKSCRPGLKALDVTQMDEKQCLKYLEQEI